MTCSFSKDFSSAGYTSVENAFIYQYLPVSNGEAVKVYLYGLFLCQNPSFDQPIKEIAKTLDIEEEKLIEYFEFWEEFGLVSILSREPFTVSYLPIRSYSTAKPRKFKAEKYTEFSKDLQLLIPSRMISTGEYTEYFTIMETYGIKPDAMITIVKYCIDRKGDDISYRYISKVAKDFGSREIVTLEKVQKELSSYVARTAEIDRILKALSLRRQADYEDLSYLKKWTDELGFDVDNIVFAAKQLKKGSMLKLDEFIMELYSIKCFSKEEISGFVKNKQNVFDLAVKINKALSVYMEVVDTAVDNYTKKWLSFGFREDTLLYIANRCFMDDKRSLKDMDDLIENLRNKGYIDLPSVASYFEEKEKLNKFIEKMLMTAGVSRRPTSWDRDNVASWRSWNFSDEMILEASKLSSGKSNPIAYINGILSNWKNNGVFTLSAIESVGVPTKPDSQEEYNREYEKRRHLALSIAQKNMEKALSLDGFNDLNVRLNTIERDLAFATISNDLDKLNALETEKTETYNKASILLKSIGLTFADLSPKFACAKCNDTGYVDGGKCDCYNK